MCRKCFLKYDTSIQVYTGVQQVQTSSLLNSIAVANEGNTIVVFQGDEIQPGTFKAINGDAGEVYAARIDIWFKMPTPAPAIPTNKAIITQKFYINENE